MKSGDIVVLDIHLNRDGTLAQPPQINLSRTGSTLPSQAATAAAMRAVEHCAPYTLPDAFYEKWKDQTVTFNSAQIQYESGLSTPSK